MSKRQCLCWQIQIFQSCSGNTIHTTIVLEKTMTNEFYTFDLALVQCTTVTDLARLCFTPVLWHPETRRCRKKQNHPLSSNLVVFWAKIQPKMKYLEKPQNWQKKTSKSVGFLTVSQSLLVLGSILAHQITKFCPPSQRYQLNFSYGYVPAM